MFERNSYKMLNYDEYRNLCCLINENPDMISVFDNMSMFSIDELSIDSHDIKNHLAYLKTSFQLLKKKSPELSDVLLKDQLLYDKILLNRKVWIV